MTALLPWVGGAILVTVLTLLMVRLPPRRALAVLVLALAAVLVAVRQFALALPLGLLAFSLWQKGGSAQGSSSPAPGQTSDVSTAWFEMTLDHDSGRIDGRIRQGDFENRLLSDLSLVELRALWAEIETGGDNESLSLLEAYISRHRSDEARPDESDARQDPPPYGSEPDMPVEEAYRVLGLEPGADTDEIRAAYHRLIRKVHPDNGGSSALAALINAARQRLDPGSSQNSPRD
ncbi:J domain-containing protein [Amaricoccus macauensis]|uniref:J domain-containing protein n=1 Tax=Amaricoccus macauensis TaxID=57001 RepID=UPI003C7D0DCD